MKIAILGWGSLIWDLRNLEICSKWHNDGPYLPIEFARLSRNGRLTLVLYPEAEDIRTYWANSAFQDLSHARENLRERECKYLRDLGCISISENLNSCQTVPRILDSIRQWCEEKGLDAVIWTDLASNFLEKTGMDFNEDNVILYLKNLTGKEQKEAEIYIRKAPKQVKTRIRRKIENELGWTFEQQ